jgi:hypothetical protein
MQEQGPSISPDVRPFDLRFMWASMCLVAGGIADRVAWWSERTDVSAICLLSAVGGALLLASAWWFARTSRRFQVAWVLFLMLLAIYHGISIGARFSPLIMTPAIEGFAGLLFGVAISGAAVLLAQERRDVSAGAAVGPVIGGAALMLIAHGIVAASWLAFFRSGTTPSSIRDLSPGIDRLFFFAGAAVVAFGVVRSVTRTHTPGRCAACDYDMAGVGGDVCPECGTRQGSAFRAASSGPAKPRLLVFLLLALLLVLPLWIWARHMDPRQPISTWHSDQLLLRRVEQWVPPAPFTGQRFTFGYADFPSPDEKLATPWALAASEELNNRWHTMPETTKAKVASVALRLLADEDRSFDDAAITVWSDLVRKGLNDGLLTTEEMQAAYERAIGLALVVRPSVQAGAVIPFDVGAKPLYHQVDRSPFRGDHMDPDNFVVDVIACRVNGQSVNTTRWPSRTRLMSLRGLQKANWGGDPPPLAIEALLDRAWMPRAPNAPGKATLELEVEISSSLRRLGNHEPTWRAHLINSQRFWVSRRATLRAEFDVVRAPTVATVVNQAELENRISRFDFPILERPLRTGPPSIAGVPEFGISCDVFAELEDGRRVPYGLWTEFMSGQYFYRFAFTDDSVVWETPRASPVAALIFAPNPTVAERTIDVTRMLTGDPVRIPVSPSSR